MGVLLARDYSRWLGSAIVLISVVALALSLIPPLQVSVIAREAGVSISPLRTLLSWQRSTPLPDHTVTFATVESAVLQADVYLPPPAPQARPAIVTVHGGSWREGDKADVPQWHAWLAAQGYVVVDVQYRLAPQPNWRIATSDVQCAVGWLKAHAAELGVDPARIALLGRSAGGHLAVLAAYTAGHPAISPSCGAPDQDTRVRAAISFYAPTDLAWGYANPLPSSVIDGPATLRAFLGGDPETAQRAYELASTVTHVSPSTPPTLLFHGGRDQLVGPMHMERLAQRLKAAGVPHRTVLLPYAHHGFDYIFDGWGAQLAQGILLDFLQRHV